MGTRLDRRSIYGVGASHRTLSISTEARSHHTLPMEVRAARVEQRDAYFLLTCVEVQHEPIPVRSLTENEHYAEPRQTQTVTCLAAPNLTDLYTHTSTLPARE